MEKTEDIKNTIELMKSSVNRESNNEMNSNFMTDLATRYTASPNSVNSTSSSSSVSSSSSSFLNELKPNHHKLTREEVVLVLNDNKDWLDYLAVRIIKKWNARFNQAAKLKSSRVIYELLKKDRRLPDIDGKNCWYSA